MKSLLTAALLGCLLGAGCAGPMDRPWDDAVYQSLRDRYADSDERIAATPAPDAPLDEPAASFAALDALSVDDAVRIAIANTPSLRRAGYQVDVAAGRVIQAGLYPNPQFEFFAESLGAEAGKGGKGGETNYLLSQELVLGGKLDRARDVAQADELAAKAAFVAEEFAVASRVTKSYFAAVAAQERLESRRQLIDLSQQLLDAANAQVDAGAATEPDRLRAEVVQAQAEIDLESARLDAHAALRSLASAIGINGTVEIPLTDTPRSLPHFPSQEAVVGAALAANSRVSLARIAIERARSVHELAKAEAVPNLVASAGPRYSDPESETTLDLGVGMEIPLFDRNQGNIRAAMADRLSSAAQLREVQLQLIAEVSEAWAAYESARIATTRYQQTLLPKAQQTLDLTRQAYERGNADYLRLLDAQQVVIESRISYVDALYRLQAAAALLRELAQTDAPWRDSSTGDSFSETQQ
jgi:cobalt-zinc-cadmium efflux system outer membrane protein